MKASEWAAAICLYKTYKDAEVATKSAGNHAGELQVYVAISFVILERLVNVNYGVGSLSLSLA